MRPFIPFFIAAGLIVMVVFKHDPWPAPDNTPKNIYDSTLLMLRDLAANDQRLGFASPLEAANAWIDLSAGLPLVYLSEDTLLATNAQLAAILKSMRRVIYPVYTTVNGRTKLCASVTFDSTGGVHPVMFDDSTLILPCLRHKAKIGGSKAKYSLIEMPFLFTTATIAHDSAGGEILDTPELDAALGSSYPDSLEQTTNGIEHLADEHFTKAARAVAASR